MNSKIAEGINDIIDVALAIKEASEDKRISWIEGVRIGSEVLDLRDEILSFDEIVLEWTLLEEEDRLNVAFQVNKKLNKKGIVNYNLDNLIKKSIEVVKSLDALIKEVKDLEKAS